MFFWLIVVIVSPTVASDDEQYTALHFGTSINDNIGFKFDMAPFRDSFSICTWAKRIHTSSAYPLFFQYVIGSSSNEILLDAIGIYKQAFGVGVSGNTQSVTKPVGSWFSYCFTWSLASRSIKLYIDGTLVGTGSTASGRTLRMGGTLFFNRLSYSTSSSYIFGGQLYQLNMFTKALSSAEVLKIADGGLCFDLTEFAETRVLKWEHILSQSRSGSVSELLMSCEWKKELDSRLKVSEEKLVNIAGQLNTTLEELGTVKRDLDSTQEELNSTQEELGTVKVHLNSTQEELDSTQEELNSTQEELGSVTSKLERTERELQTETAQHNKTEEKLDTCSTSLTSEPTLLRKCGTVALVALTCGTRGTNMWHLWHYHVALVALLYVTCGTCGTSMWHLWHYHM